MQAQGIDLPAAEILTPSPPPRIGSVQTLGLSDVLQVELHPCQVAGFADELAELRGPLVEGVRVRPRALAHEFALRRRQP